MWNGFRVYNLILAHLLQIQAHENCDAEMCFNTYKTKFYSVFCLCLCWFVDMHMLWLYFFRECPDELEEAISGIIYAASRCGDFPELQEIRAVFTSRYGKEFADRAVELRNNCRVNHKVYHQFCFVNVLGLGQF